MDPDKARRLSIMVWQQRLKSAVPIFVLLCLLMGGMGLYFYDDQNAERSPVAGTVETWSRQQDAAGASSYIMTVHLKSGGTITATASRHSAPPKIGAPITLQKIQTPLGRTSYLWVR